MIVPVRQIKLETPNSKDKTEGVRELDNVRSTESPYSLVDIARLGTTNREYNATPFRMSACGVNEDDSYYAFKFKRDESSSGTSVNIWKPLKVELELGDYWHDSSLGDGHSVISMETSDSSPENVVSGDSGSPVLNSSNEVVGVITNANGDNVAVTLVEAFLDLIPWRIDDDLLNNIPCSMRGLPMDLVKIDKDIRFLKEKSGDQQTEFPRLNWELAKLKTKIYFLEKKLGAQQREFVELKDLVGSIISSLPELEHLKSRFRLLGTGKVLVTIEIGVMGTE